MIACGFYENVITPKLGSMMPGSVRERNSTGIKDELFAKAFVWENGDITAAMISVDAIDLTRREVERIRARVAAFSTLHAEHVTICATHSHTSGPTIRTSYVKAVDEQYLDQLVQRAADACVMAYQRRRPARIGFGLGHESNISFQRRHMMKDGSVRTNPGVKNPDIVKAAGPIDPDVAVIRIEDLDGKPMGLITNFACHPDTIGGLLYSGDYPGALSRTLKKVYGNEIVSMFLQGASGNINHIDVSGKLAIERSTHYETMGRILASQVINVGEKMNLHTSASVELKVKQTHVPVKFRLPTETELLAARHLLQSEKEESEAALNFANQVVQLAERGEEETKAEIQVWSAGDAAMVFLPAEIFVEFGLKIKQESPFALTIVTELSNGSVSGYVCTQEAYKQTGYENQLREYSRLEVGAGDIFVKHALKLLNELKSENVAI